MHNYSRYFTCSNCLESQKHIGYVWFSENLKENAKERKYKGKVEEKKK